MKNSNFSERIRIKKQVFTNLGRAHIIHLACKTIKILRHTESCAPSYLFCPLCLKIPYTNSKKHSAILYIIFYGTQHDTHCFPSSYNHNLSWYANM